MDKFLKAIGYFFDKLSSKPDVGGLAITDSAVWYLLIKKNEIVTYAMRLPPGVLKQGKILDAAQFLNLLRQLHSLVSKGHPAETLKVIVSLPPELVYTQSFTVPNISGEKLEEAIHLNLQMISPLPASEVYMSSQIISEGPDQYELLGAFVEKKAADEYRALLEAARFYVFLFEPPALSLSRIIIASVGRASGPLLALQVSSDGLDLFILRGGALFFDYFRSWSSIQGEAREIPRAVFEAAVVEEVQRVINFSLSRFKEEPKQILLLAPGFEEELKKLLENHFKIPASPFRAAFYNLSEMWYTALGSALRGVWERTRDKFIALGSEGVFTPLYQERILSFMRLWRSILWGTLGLFLLLFTFSALVLTRQAGTLNERARGLRTAGAEKDLELLEAKAAEFNKLVEAIKSIRGSANPWIVFFERLTSLTGANRITIDRLDISSIGETNSLTARAPDHNAVIKFKNILAGDPYFSSVDLPLSQITVAPDNAVIFNISFKFNPSPPQTKS